MEHFTTTTSRRKDNHPFDKAPQVKHCKGNTHIKQTQGRQFRSGSSSDQVQQAITGFNTKAKAILLIDLKWMHFQEADNDIGKVKEALPFVATFGILASNVDLESLGRIKSTGASVSGDMALTTFEQSLGTSLFAADGQGHYGRKRLLLEIFNHSIIIKFSIQKQPFEADIQRFDPFLQPFEDIYGFIRITNHLQGQGVSFVVLDGVQGSISMKMRRVRN